MNLINLNENRGKKILFMLGAACVLTMAQFMIQGKVGFNLWDEGFLWYGSQRVLAGEVPIRDFMAYHPGRYYWSAAVMALIGNDGIVSQRVACYIFQGLGLFFALILLARTGTRSMLLLLSGTAIVILWMFPGYKTFDAGISIFLIAALAYLADRQTDGRYFVVGVIVGAVAMFGRNHGLYGGVASIGLILYLHFRNENKEIRLLPSLFSWSAGVFVGFLPFILLFFIVPGFTESIIKTILTLFDIKGTNLPLPVPWPWRCFDEPGSRYLFAHRFFVGVCFIGLIVFGVGGLIHAIRSRINNSGVSSIFIASAFLTLPYAHYAFSRADIHHLALGIFPMIFGIIAYLSERTVRVKILGVLLFFIISIFAVLPLHPRWVSFLTGNWVTHKIGHDTLLIDPGTAKDLDMMKDLVDTYARGDRTFIAVPYWPGAYALFHRKSPMWEIYPLVPRSVSFQLEEIREIKQADPGLAIIYDYALDGRDQQRFRNSHPLIDKYIRDNFLPVVHPDASERGFRIYKRHMRRI